MTKQRNYILYLEDIQTAMLCIQEYIANLDVNSFKEDYKTIDAVIRNFEIIGEATKNLPKAVKDRYPDTPWKEMYRLRNRIRHEYFGIDFRIIWRIATDYLPENLEQINEILIKEKASIPDNN
ncbi:MAG: DUF86 domain-containing protein [Adhaeribacter sp.]